MIYQFPKLEAADSAVIELINEQRSTLRHHIDQNPGRWSGFLRRNTFARAMQGSNSIEGINADLAEVVAVVDDERPDFLKEETTRALISYRIAMTYIMRTHNDPHFEINIQLIRSLHYMMINYDLTKLPGQWRPGPIFVVRDENQERVYQGPDSAMVPGLMAELAEQIKQSSVADPMVRAALAHLNLTMIHPFKDGNGRMARALQTLVLAHDGILAPVFCSIEEWLGRNTQAYYDVLANVGQGSWHPENDALPWVRFCLVAHYQQAATLIKRNQEIGRTWDEIEIVANRAGLDERVQGALMDAAFGYRVRNSRYREEVQVSEVIASRDLKKLCEAAFLVPVGEKRGRYYVAAPLLKQIREKCRDRTRAPNPYQLLIAGTILPAEGQLALPGLSPDY
ncbi:MAG: Fic family protein [Alphaproteobacteria bacterium]|nr:Fic family protein [Alphaproteobacteria bacterium]